MNVKPFLANSILICSITCSGCFSISDFDFCYKLICTIAVLFIIKPESLLIAASLAVKHNLFIIETKTSQTDLKPDVNNQNQKNFSAYNFTYTVAPSCFQSKFIVFNINVGTRNAMFEFRERLGNRCFKGIIHRIPEDYWVFLNV